MGVVDAWQTKRDELLHSATDILGEMRRIGLAEFAPAGLSEDSTRHGF